MTVLRLVFNMCRGNCDAPGTFLRRLVNVIIGREFGPTGLRQNLRDRSRQRRLAVVNMANRPNVAMGLRTFKFFLRHGLDPSISSKLGTDFVRHRLRYLFVVIEMHCELCPALGCRAQVIYVAKHVCERHHSANHLSIAP